MSGLEVFYCWFAICDILYVGMWWCIGSICVWRARDVCCLLHSTIARHQTHILMTHTGEVIAEEVADTRGIGYGDEYLFTLDAYGRSRGCQKLYDLGLKHEQLQQRKEYFLPMKEDREEGVTTTTAPPSVQASSSSSSSSQGGSSSSVKKKSKKHAAVLSTQQQQEEQQDNNLFKVPLFVSYASTQDLKAVLGPDLVSAILKSGSVRVDAQTDEVHLVGSKPTQRQALKGPTTTSATAAALLARESAASASSAAVTAETAAPATKKRKKKADEERVTNDALLKGKKTNSKAKPMKPSANLKKLSTKSSKTVGFESLFREYSRDMDEEKLIKRSRILSQREAR